MPDAPPADYSGSGWRVTGHIRIRPTWFFGLTVLEELGRAPGRHDEVEQARSVQRHDLARTENRGRIMNWLAAVYIVIAVLLGVAVVARCSPKDIEGDYP